MSSWVLLLAALAAFVRFACTEGDPLPAALVELVRSSPISSIQDLQLLLEPDSVDEDPDSQTSTRHHANGTSKRLPRSLAAEQAQQALCKVRTEVLEVTRDMLDRRNANFMLWPPCVEVQRCSGCCNSRAIQCVPIVSRTRNLQVMKIQYINKRPHYDKAVISVQDHVECRCQSSAPPPAPRAPPKKPQHALQPQRPAPKTPPLKTPSKEELHRQDELKQNQNRNLRPDDRDSQRPPRPAKRATAPPPTAQTQPSRLPATAAAAEGRTQAERTHAEPRQSAAVGGREPPPPTTQETLGAHRDQGEGKPPHRSGGDGDGGAARPHVEQHCPLPHPHGQSPNTTAHHTAPQRPTEGEREDRAHPHHTQAGSPPQLGSVSHNHDHSHSRDHNHKDDHSHNQNHSHDHSHSHVHNHKDDHSHDQNHNHNDSHSHVHNHKDDHSHDQNHNHDDSKDRNHNHNPNHSHTHNHSQDRNHNQTEKTEQRQHVVEPHKDRELPETAGERLLQPSLQAKQELLLLQKKLEQEKEQLKQQEQLQRHHHQQEHHLHHRMQVHTTTKKPVTPAPTPAMTTARPPPPPPPTQRAPKRHAPFHRRPRKNRRRISKATMRAMLM